MTFEVKARMTIQQMPEYELNKLSNGLGTNRQNLNQPPLSNLDLQGMAQQELSSRYEPTFDQL